MKFRLYRIIRGGRKFPNGSFDLLSQALKAKENGELWHTNNRTSAKFVIETEDGKPIPDNYSPEDEDQDERQAPIEEDRDVRIRQLESELERANRRLEKLQEEEVTA